MIYKLLVHAAIVSDCAHCLTETMLFAWYN